MRIALLSFHYAEYVYQLARALALEHNVLLLLSEQNALGELVDYERILQKRNPHVLALPDRRAVNPLMILNTFQIIRAIRGFKAEVVHLQETPRDYLLAALPILLNYPCVLTVHDHSCHSGERDRRRVQLYRKLLRKLSDAVIVHGETIAIESTARFPSLKGKVHSVPHGVLGHCDGPYEADWEKGTILFFGRIKEYKGIRYFIEAVDQINRTTPVKAVIAGFGDALSQYRDRILSDPCFELIEKFIPQEEVSRIFKRANVVVLPYTDATQSGVASLALKYGRPVVATRVGGLVDVVREGYTGFLVPPRQAVKLAKAIEKLITDQSLAREMSRNAVALSANEFSWATVAKKTTRVYTYTLLQKRSQIEVSKRDNPQARQCMNGS